MNVCVEKETCSLKSKVATVSIYMDVAVGQANIVVDVEDISEVWTSKGWCRHGAVRGHLEYPTQYVSQSG